MSSLEFWTERAAMLRRGSLGILQAVNLTASEDEARRRHEAEINVLSQMLTGLPTWRMVVTELGCGTGRLTEFLSRVAHSVVAYDGVREFVDVARTKVRSRRVSFHVGDCRKLLPAVSSSMCVAAGLLCCMDDHDARGVAVNLSRAEWVLLRESVGTRRRVELRNVWSPVLGSLYAATYRTVDEIVMLLPQHRLVRQESVEYHRESTHLRALLLRRCL